jgi:hypothetical protein
MVHRHDYRHVAHLRVLRSTELRVHGVETDARADQFIGDAAVPVRLIANRPDRGDPQEYEHKLREAQDTHHLGPNQRVLFVEVRPADASAFSGDLRVKASMSQAIASSAASAPPSRTRWPRCFCTCAIARDTFRTRTSGGRKGIRLPTC